MVTRFDPHQKPSPLQCPRHFCVFWCEADSWVAPGSHASLPDALEAVVCVTEPYCGCSHGRCIRLDSIHGDNDWYEPDEPALERAGLPWFYFFPVPYTLVEEVQAAYIRESEALWGKEHWKK